MKVKHNTAGLYFYAVLELLVSLRNRTGEKRRRQTLCDKRDNNFL